MRLYEAKDVLFTARSDIRKALLLKTEYDKIVIQPEFATKMIEAIDIILKEIEDNGKN